MTRPIKFRAWSTVTKNPGMIEIDPLRNPRDPLNFLIETDCWHVMQFTGLLDREGKEIFESDIVAIPYTDPAGNSILDPKNRGRIEFNHGSFGVVVEGCPVPVDVRAFCETERTEYASNYGTFAVLKQTTELLVVGNIFEEQDGT
jgi:uncharacterized phage protein (TIGR01671 family)